MEMIDVLKKLQEITDKSPEVAKAVENVKATNPKEVKENAVESEPAITEYKVGSYKDFLASKGIDIYKLKGDEHSKYAQLYKAEKERAHADATTHKGTDDHREISRIMKHEDEPTKEGGMSDVHIGAQEKVGEFIDADGNLSAPKQDVLQSLEQQRASAPFPESYEIETAIKMGVHPRAEISSSDEVKEYLDIGVRHFSIGTDITILRDFWKNEGEKISKSLEGF